MPIVRIFRVVIHSHLRDEFEKNFESISVSAVTGSHGALSVRIVKPTAWTPNEYAMISEWESEEALKHFAGEEWNRAVIPPGMEVFAKEYWVHHYTTWIETRTTNESNDIWIAERLR